MADKTLRVPGYLTDGSTEVSIKLADNGDGTYSMSTSGASGGATSAKQDTIIGYVDGIEASLTTLLGYTDGIEGSLTTLNTKVSTPSAIANGRKTVTTSGTPVALASTATCRYVTVTALRTNTDIVTVGGAGVVAASGTRTGIPLSPGQSASFPIDDIAKVFVDSVVNGEGVAFAYFS